MRINAVLIVTIFTIGKSTSQSSEETTGLGSANSVNFNEIFSNSLRMLADDSLAYSNIKDDYGAVNSVPIVSSVSRTTVRPLLIIPAQLNTRPPPREPDHQVIHNNKIATILEEPNRVIEMPKSRRISPAIKMGTQIKMDNNPRRKSRLPVGMSGPKSRFLKASSFEETVHTSPSLEEIIIDPEIVSVKRTIVKPTAVAKTPSKKILISTITTPHHIVTSHIGNPEYYTNSLPQLQRGVLDLIMPPVRVRSFKHVFERFRKLLSYTFRK